MAETAPTSDNILWKFYWDCGRMGSVESIFTATQEEIDSILGKVIYFGEILGKHSEIYGPLFKENLTLLSSDQTFVNEYTRLVGNIGHNPFDYLEEEEE